MARQAPGGAMSGKAGWARKGKARFFMKIHCPYCLKEIDFMTVQIDKDLKFILKRFRPLERGILI